MALGFMCEIVCFVLVCFLGFGGGFVSQISSIYCLRKRQDIGRW